MQNYTVETGGRTFTIMADNYRIVNNEYIFEAAGIEVKKFSETEIKNVLTENNTGGGEYYNLIKS